MQSYVWDLFKDPSWTAIIPDCYHLLTNIPLTISTTAQTLTLEILHGSRHRWLWWNPNQHFRMVAVDQPHVDQHLLCSLGDDSPHRHPTPSTLERVGIQAKQIKAPAGRSRHGAPERANHKTASTRTIPSTDWRFAWQRMLSPFPLAITQIQANHFYSPKTSELRVVCQLKCQHDLVSIFCLPHLQSQMVCKLRL